MKLKSEMSVGTGSRVWACAGTVLCLVWSASGCTSDTDEPSVNTTGNPTTGVAPATTATTTGTAGGTTSGSTTTGQTTTGGGTTSTTGGGTTSTAGGTTGEDAGNQATGGQTTGTGGESTTTGPDPADCDASAAPEVSVLGLETVVTDSSLQSVVYAEQPPGSDDWYLMELTGKIWVYTDGALRDTPFLDLSAQVMRNDFYDERGLLGMTFAPNYQESGKMYVAMVPTTGDDANHDLLLEFTRSGSDPYVADTASRRAIVDLPPQGQAGGGWNNYHNGNTPMFGPDGMLYFGIGDGGGECNAANPGAPQDPGEPYGKILRLDPSAPAPHAAEGNPFADSGDARVYHMGLRNPFRFSFDSATGDLYIGDVGQWDYEEIDVAPSGMSGLNFGWPDYEAEDAESCPDGTSLREGDAHATPAYVLPHGANAGAAALVMSVVGGVVYRGQALPDLYGVYLFGEYYATRPMAALTYCKGETSPAVSILKSCDPNTPDAACFRSDGAPLAEVGAIIEGNDKEIYLPANGNTLFKVVPAE